MPTAYDTTNLYNSPITYYGTTSADRPEISVEIDTVSTEFRLVEADEFSILAYNTGNTYNTSFTYEGDSPFREITSSVTSISINRGRTAQTYDHFDAGTATITLIDFDSTFMPGNPNSIHYPYLTTMRPIRVRCNWSGEDFSIFRGYVDRWQVDWEPDLNAAKVTVTATDLFKVLAKLDTVVAGLDGDSPKTRIDDILDAHAIPADFRVIDTGVTTLQMDVTDRRPVLGNLQEIETAESGALFIDGFGRIVFKDRNNALPTGAGTTFTDTGSSASVNYSTIRTSTDDETLYNFVSATITGGTEQTAGDATSEDTYQRRSLVLTDLLLETDALALSLAQHLITVRKEPEVRIEEVGIQAYLSLQNTKIAVEAELLDALTLYRTAPGSYSFNKALFVSGIQHSITPSNWEVTFSTQHQVP